MKKSSILFFLLGCLIAGTIANLAVERTDAQAASSEPAWANVNFTNHRYALIFFDKETGEIYSYAENGKLLEVWVIKELGKDLVKKSDIK
ncbi:MAG: hypothetical protein ACYTFM_10620 [Planctomycetota bacterium]|jgi:hypothetical protein